MQPEETIFVLSVQHTGTWFVIDLLKAHPDVAFFSECLHFLQAHPHLSEPYQACADSLLGPNGKKVWVKPFPAGADYDPQLLKRFVDAMLEALHGKGRALLHSHTQSPRRRLTGVCAGNLFMHAFHGLFKTVVPIRDPLLALIARHHRNPTLHNSNIVDDFECVIELSRPDCFFLPVDLHTSAVQRLELLKRLLRFVGLSFQPYVERIARDWKPRNSKGIYDLKRRYEERNLAKIAEVIPDELDHLMSRARFVRPFLEELGYRNLIWWQ